MANKRKPRPTKMWRTETHNHVGRYPGAPDKTYQSNYTHQAFGELDDPGATLREMNERTASYCQPTIYNEGTDQEFSNPPVLDESFGPYNEVWVAEIVWRKVEL